MTTPATHRVFSNLISVTSNVFQTVIDIFEIAAEKRYHAISLKNVIARSITPATWVSADMIQRPDVIERVKCYLNSNCVTLPRTEKSGQRVTCKILCNLHDQALHYEAIEAFRDNLADIKAAEKRKLQIPTAWATISNQNPIRPISPSANSAKTPHCSCVRHSPYYTQ